jgi:hypothetical protein
MFGHQCKRAVKDSLEDLTRCARAAAAEFPVLLAESRTALRSDDRVAETNYQEGKVQNLQRAAAEINGAFLQAGKTFSFWKEVGRTSKRRGYAVGRTLQEGCLIPAVGGGLCQLSNAIYDAALQSGCEIVERHAHSQVVPGSTAAEGRDATVTWNYGLCRSSLPRAASPADPSGVGGRRTSGRILRKGGPKEGSRSTCSSETSGSCQGRCCPSDSTHLQNLRRDRLFPLRPHQPEAATITHCPLRHSVGPRSYRSNDLIERR